LASVEQILAARNNNAALQAMAGESLNQAQEPHLSAALAEAQGKLSDPRFRPRLEALERFATLGEEATHRTPALETLAALGRPETPQAAFQLLVDLGLWSRHENLSLRRSQIPTQFPTKVLEVVQCRLDSPPPDRYSEDRLDLTHLKVYTIDDESTSEIDDGLSLEFLTDGRQRLWVHIADPTRWLMPGDELDLEARRRSTTLYLPTGMIPMFPSQLATGPMSLVQGRICCALSFGVVLDQAGAVEDYTIQISLIKPTYRLTYDDVDEMLELGIQAEPEISAIAAWAKRRQAWRESQGAISIHMPECSIKVQDDEITIQVLEDSMARQLVAEMMILAGEVAGRYGQTHQLAIPFRNQPQPELPPDEELLRLPAGAVRSCAIRRCMPRSEVSTTPGRHASLGLDTYTQVTSPIRRYGDLLSHFQIKAHLKGDPLPFSLEDVKELLQSISSTAYEAVQVERQTNRYWGLEFLRRNTHEVWSALVLRWLREHESLALVLLEDLGLELAMRFFRPVEPGDRVDIRVAYADPRQDTIQLQELSDREMQSALT
ncbi:MAG: ribonuclease R family protein, partial [Leptolyngbyaceae bacterium]|nr:ribonuclease R family protein [Leptolyngbyaceae bacterium]